MYIYTYIHISNGRRLSKSHYHSLYVYVYACVCVRGSASEGIYEWALFSMNSKFGTKQRQRSMLRKGMLLQRGRQ